MYVASGLPIVLVGSTLQAWYTMADVNLMTIGLLTLVGMPYVYKFIWAPLFDRFVPIPLLGRRRGWIVIMQTLLVLGLVGMSFLNPKHDPTLLAVVAFLVAICSASQDVAMDAYRTDLLPNKERGLGASALSVGYRIGILIASSVVLVLAAYIGWHLTYLLMALLMMVLMVVTLLSPPIEEKTAPKSMRQAVVAPLKEFLTRKNAILILLFIVLYKVCDAFALSLNSTFLLRGIGFSLQQVGYVTKLDGMIAAMLGSILGGWMLPRLGLFRSLIWFGLAQMLSNLMFALMAVVGKSMWLMVVSIFVDYFCGALSMVAFVVFITSLCNQHYTATQYALFSAVSAIGRVFIGPEAAVIVEHVGWVQFYFWTFVSGLPSLFIIWWLKRDKDFSGRYLTQTHVP